MSYPASPSTRLVIVPCGRAKVWDKHPDAGPTAAADAYSGAPFTVNRNYAERAGGDWVILSAKYGFLRPVDLIPGPYEVTFKRRATNPIEFGALRDQVTRLGLCHYAEVIGLGGKEYRAAVEAAFAWTSVALDFPFSGLPIGKAMGATKRATEA
jgi:cytoplasmic iron level regulating protein YaaA (DUF328/UPF0246 family)